MTHTPCRDCEIKYDAHAGESIAFCPLHEAAPELVKALEAWMIYYQKHSTMANRDRAYGMTREVLGKVGGRDST